MHLFCAALLAVNFLAALNEFCFDLVEKYNQLCLSPLAGQKRLSSRVRECRTCLKSFVHSGQCFRLARLI